MHGDGNISKSRKPTGKSVDGPRKSNDCFTPMKQFEPPKLLFDQFWREGELAMLFGPAGNGKSVLATQIADGIARGRPLNGFSMTAKRQRVLYVDLRLSDRHFELRYTSDTPKNGVYPRFKFAEELYRRRPAADEDLYEWLRKSVSEEGYRVVMIDDLSAVRSTCGGTRETLKLMRKLRSLIEEFDLSILVLAGCREAGRTGLINEGDLQRSRVLCEAADSVFALGWHPQVTGRGYLVQTRSACTLTLWGESNAPVCRLQKFDGTFLGFAFDKRFRPKYDPERHDLICNLHLAREDGATYRDLAEMYDVSRSTAARLLKLFEPWMLEGRVIEVPEDEPEDEEHTDPSDARSEGDPPEPEIDDLDPNFPAEPDEPEPPPEPPPPEHATVREILLALGMRQTVDENGREIFIEKEDATTRHVWYRFDARDRFSPLDLLSRFESSGYASIGTRLDGPICKIRSG